MCKVNGKYLLFCRHSIKECIWTQKHLVLSPLRSQIFLCVLLVTGMVSMYLPVLPTQAATTETTDQLQLKANKQENRPLTWADILNLFRRKKVALGSRGEICAIAPGLIETRVVWNERPLFLWQGIGQKIEVRITNSQKALWNQTLSLANRSATYDGSALQPGGTYDWVLFDQLSQPTRFSFQFMAAKRRDRIAADLMALSAQLKIKEASAETIALQRANYFAEHNLWSDVLQEVFSVKNPDAALTQFKQEFLGQLCAPQKK